MDNPNRHISTEDAINANVFSITHHLSNVNQTHNEISPHTCEDGYYQKEVSGGEGVKKRTLGEDSRWWLGQGIRIPELCDSKNYLEILELHLGNSDFF
jgi:hypothetical protein